MKELAVKKRHTIRKDDAARLFERLRAELGPEDARFRSDRVEVVETGTPVVVYLVDKKPLLFTPGTWVFPTVRGAIERPFQGRRITVDRGAIPFVVKGADVMRPGIVTISPDVRAGSPVIIADDTHGKPLAVAEALHDAAAMQALEKGKMAKTIHFVGDTLWNLEL